VVDLLREAGLESCLVDMGEIRALGTHADGKPWRAALQGPVDTAKTPAAIDLVNKAVATSAASGFQFDKSGQSNHIFNPVSGRCADPARALSVVSDTAASADALSTACALMEDKQIVELLRRAGGTRAFVSTAAGTMEL
jgi:thiamine biosynthesis lipoprotein